MAKKRGIPKVYTKEWLEEEAESFDEWMDKKESIFFNQFAVERGYSPQRLSEFAKASEVFSEVYARAKDWQEAKITSLALWKKLEPGFSKWVLSVHHQRHAVEDLGIDKISGTSKDLVNDGK